jgi:REP element-mobilizing transposase RayT
MANTYRSLHYHFTFSTKNRESWIAEEIETRVCAYIGGIARQHNMTALQVGGIEDHIHALVRAPPTHSPSQIAQYLKGESSKWIHEKFLKLRVLNGRTVMVRSQSAGPKSPVLLNTSRISETITARRLFKKSIWTC